MDGCTCFFDSIFGISIKDICDRHDRRYSNTRLTRRQADILLYRAVKRRVGMPVAIIMYVGVRTFGWLRYEGK